MRNVLIFPGTVAGAVLLTTSMASGQASDPIVYDNMPSGYNPDGITSSQLDTAYPFNSQVADDFVLSGDFFITGMTWVGGFFNGDPIEVPAWNLIMYNDAGGTPTGGGLADPSVSAFFIAMPGVVNRVDNGDGTFTWSTDFGSSIALTGGTTYWVAIQGEHFFPPQYGQAASLDQVGNFATSGFPLLGTDYWTGLPYDGVSDVAFQLHGVVIPTPGALALIGLAGLVSRRRRRR